jgi:hypothetical protein
MDRPSATSVDLLDGLVTWSTSHRHNPAAPHRLGRETPSNKASRLAVETTGALLVLAALAVFFASPSHTAGIVVALLVMAGLVLICLGS